MLKTRKYVDITYQNPRGVVLTEILKKYYVEWEEIYNSFVEGIPRIQKANSKTSYVPSAKTIIIDTIFNLGFLNLTVEKLYYKLLEEGYPEYVIGKCKNFTTCETIVRVPLCILTFDQWFESKLFQLSYKIESDELKL